MSLSGLSGSSATGLFNYGFFSQGAKLVVAGNTYLADFHGNIKVLLDPNVLAQFMSGAISMVSLHIQEFVADGVGNGIGPITMRLDPDRDPPQSKLTSITSGQPFPAVQDYIVNMHVTIPNLLPGITLRTRANELAVRAINRAPMKSLALAGRLRLPGSSLGTPEPRLPGATPLDRRVPHPHRRVVSHLIGPPLTLIGAWFPIT